MHRVEIDAPTCPGCGGRHRPALIGGAHWFCASRTGESVDAIMLFEAGELPAVRVLALFSDLVRSGMAWTLQGSYGRTAEGLIREGFLDREGRISAERLDELDAEEWALRPTRG